MITVLTIAAAVCIAGLTLLGVSLCVAAGRADDSIEEWDARQRQIDEEMRR